MSFSSAPMINLATVDINQVDPKYKMITIVGQFNVAAALIVSGNLSKMEFDFTAVFNCAIEDLNLYIQDESPNKGCFQLMLTKQLMVATVTIIKQLFAKKIDFKNENITNLLPLSYQFISFLNKISKLLRKINSQNHNQLAIEKKDLILSSIQSCYGIVCLFAAAQEERNDNYHSALSNLNRIQCELQNADNFLSDILLAKIHLRQGNFKACFKTILYISASNFTIDEGNKNDFPNLLYSLYFELKKHKNYELALKVLNLLSTYYAQHESMDVNFKKKSAFIKIWTNEINDAITLRVATKNKEILEEKLIEMEKLMKELEVIGFCIHLAENCFNIKPNFSIDLLNLEKYKRYDIKIENESIIVNHTSDTVLMTLDFFKTLRIDVHQFVYQKNKSEHTPAIIKQDLIAPSSIPNQNLIVKDDQNIQYAVQPSKKTQQKKEKAAVSLSLAEKLGFSSEFSDKKIVKLKSPKYPIGSYYMFFDKPNTNVDKKILEAHQACVEKGMLNHGIEYVKKCPDTFKTHIPSRSPAGDFRMWSRVAQEIVVDGKRKVLLAFDQPHNHKSQKRLLNGCG